MIQIDVDDRAVLAALARLREQARDPSPAFREIVSSLVDEIRLGFTDSRSPYGVPWKPLSPATRSANKGRRRGGQPLLDTGKLRSSITFRLLGKQGVEVGTSDYEKKAAHHQWGSKKTSGRGSGVPARPFLPIRGQTADLPEH